MTNRGLFDAATERLSLRRLPHAIWLIGVWVALWGDLSLGNVVNGGLMATLIGWFFWHAGPRPVEAFRPWSAMRYAGLFAAMLVQSTIQVVVAVIRPERVAPGIVAVDMRAASDAVVTLVANSVTLTPGTLTLETKRQDGEVTLYVHALDARDVPTLRAGILRLEKLAIAAFGHPDVRQRPSPLADASRTGETSDHA
ncbi:MAG: Na+/H+ antiporter subunit E [Egibacteraceae bacterium]